MQSFLPQQREKPSAIHTSGASDACCVIPAVVAGDDVRRILGPCSCCERQRKGDQQERNLSFFDHVDLGNTGKSGDETQPTITNQFRPGDLTNSELTRATSKRKPTFRAYENFIRLVDARLGSVINPNRSAGLADRFSQQLPPHPQAQSGLSGGHICPSAVRGMPSALLIVTQFMKSTVWKRAASGVESIR